MIKLPESVADVEVSVVGTAKRYKFTVLQRMEVGIHAVHTEAQLKQAVRDALEEAARVAETAAHRLGGYQFAANAIRTLIKEKQNETT